MGTTKIDRLFLGLYSFASANAQTVSSCIPEGAEYRTPVRVYSYSNASNSFVITPSGKPISFF
ncbi:MAG: hypothetical protein WKF71_17610 [Pyrinomonadaceae bacterium]